MKNTFFNRSRFLALVMVLGLFLLPRHVLAKDEGWQSLVDEFSVLMEKGLHQRALVTAQKILFLAEAEPGKDKRNLVLSLNVLAFTYWKLALFDKVAPLYQRAVAIQEQVFGPEHPETATSLNNLAFAYVDLAQYEGALPLYLRALSIQEKAFGHQHIITATVQNNLAQTYFRLGQFDRAVPLLLSALAIREKALGQEHPETALSLNDLAFTYRELAQYEEALLLDQRALAIREKVLGSAHPETATSLNNVAQTYFKLGKFEVAIPFLQRSLVIREKTLGSEHPSTALSLNDLGMTYANIALYDKALPLFERALAIHEKVLGANHPGTALVLNNLALIHIRLSQYDAALQLLQRALGINEKVLGPEHPDTAMSLNNLALTHGYLAQHGRAQPLFQRALAINEKALGIDHPNTALSLSNLAFTLGNLAQFEKAVPLEQRAFAIRARVLGPEHPDTANSLNNLAFTFNQLGQPELAVAFYKSAVNVYQNLREQVSRIDATALRSYTGSVSYTYQALANLLVDQGLLPEAQLVLDMLKEEEQFDFIRRSSSADPRRTRIGYNRTEQLWMTRYRQIADRLVALGAEEQVLQKQSKLGLSSAQKERLLVLKSDLLVAQAAFQTFLEEMQSGFARQGPSKATEVSETSLTALAELQGLLKGVGQDAVLLQYYVTDGKVGMLLTTPGVQLARSTSVSSKELNRQIAEFRRVLRDPKADVLKASQALYQLLVAPVAQDLEQSGAKTVMLSLDGALRYLPFGALHDGKRYIAERWNLPIYTSVTKNRLRDAWHSPKSVDK